MKTLLKLLTILSLSINFAFALKDCKNPEDPDDVNCIYNSHYIGNISNKNNEIFPIGGGFYISNNTIYKFLEKSFTGFVHNDGNSMPESYNQIYGDYFYESILTKLDSCYYDVSVPCAEYDVNVYIVYTKCSKNQIFNVSTQECESCPDGEKPNPKTNKCEPKCNVDKIQSGNYTFQDLADCVCKFGNDNPCSPHLEQAINNCQNSFSCSVDNVYKDSTPIAYKADENGKVWAYFKPIMCTDDSPETYNSINSIPSPNCKPTIPPADDNKTEEPPKDNDNPDKPHNPDNPADPKPDDGAIDINPKPKPKPNPDNPDKPSDPNNPPVPGDGNNKGDSDSPDDGDLGTNHSGGNGGGSSNNFDDTDIVNSINKTNELLEKEGENIEKIKDRLGDLLDSDDYKDFDKDDLESDIKDSKGLLKKIKEVYDTIKKGLEKTTKEAKDQVVDIKRSIDNAVDKLKKPLGGSITTYKTCSCLYSKPLNLGFKTISVEIDPCKIICQVNSVTYLVFFATFFYVFLRFTIFALFRLF